jgi:plasmid stability protein
MNLPDALLERARERAAAEHRTVTSLVEEALRSLLDGQRPSAPAVLPTDGHPEGRFLVDIDDKEAMRAIFDEEDLKDMDDLFPRR